MKNIKKIKIGPDETIKKALSVISNGGIKIALVVDKKDKLIGTLTDGDIRRGFLKGLNINSSIKSIIFKKPIVVKKKSLISDELIKIALSKMIYQIPVVNDSGKVIGIHILDELIKFKNKTNKVVIMAGGKGMRLRPLTKNIPKPMLKVGNKPILQTIIENFKKNGFGNFIVCVNYKSKIIKNYFGNGKKFDVKIDYIEEKVQMGTAGALSLIKKNFKEPFFLINGDLLTNLDFEKIIDFHNKHNSMATMSIAEYNFISPYGEVVLKNLNITSIKEKPKHKFYVNAGIYLLDPRCLKLVPKKYYDIPTLFTKIISKNYKTVSFPLGEYWVDIGRMNDFKKANLEYKSIFNN